MTSEVMLMNLEAVALAADSAVTIEDYSTDPPRVLTQNNIDKIFTVNEEGPIGALISGNGTFGGAPWRVVFDEFKRTTAKSAVSVSSITQDLVRFLAGAGPIGSGAAFELPMVDTVEESNFTRYVFHAIAYLNALVDRQSALAGSADALFSSALDQLDDEIAFDTDYVRDIANPSDERRPRPTLGQPTPRLVELIRDHIDNLIARYIALPGSHLREFSSRLKSRLREIIVKSFMTDWMPPTLPVAGIVAAGFGAKQIQPSYEHFNVYGAIGGVLKVRRKDSGTATHNGEHVIVRSFAQDDAIRTFLFGARYEFWANTYYAASEVIDYARDELLKGISSNPTLNDQIVESMEIARRATLIGLSAATRAHRAALRETMDVRLSSCTADPLAEHAKRLLQFEVLEHELSGEPSVGGQISVMAMSKGYKHQWHA